MTHDPQTERLTADQSRTVRVRMDHREIVDRNVLRTATPEEMASAPIVKTRFFDLAPFVWADGPLPAGAFNLAPGSINSFIVGRSGHTYTGREMGVAMADTDSLTARPPPNERAEQYSVSPLKSWLVAEKELQKIKREHLRLHGKEMG